MPSDAKLPEARTAILWRFFASNAWYVRTSAKNSRQSESPPRKPLKVLMNRRRRVPSADGVVLVVASIEQDRNPAAAARLLTRVEAVLYAVGVDGRLLECSRGWILGFDVGIPCVRQPHTDVELPPRAKVERIEEALGVIVHVRPRVGVRARAKRHVICGPLLERVPAFQPPRVVRAVQHRIQGHVQLLPCREGDAGVHRREWRRRDRAEGNSIVAPTPNMKPAFGCAPMIGATTSLEPGFSAGAAGGLGRLKRARNRSPTSTRPVSSSLATACGCAACETSAGAGGVCAEAAVAKKTMAPRRAGRRTIRVT